MSDTFPVIWAQTRAFRPFIYLCYYGGYNCDRNLDLEAGEKLRLMNFKGFGCLFDTLMHIEMPGAETPDVEWVIDVDGKEIEDWTLEEYKTLLGFYPPIPQYGGVSMYDTVNRLYAGVTLWDWPFGKNLTLYLQNLSEVSVKVWMWNIQLYCFKDGTTYYFLGR